MQSKPQVVLVAAEIQEPQLALGLRVALEPMDYMVLMVGKMDIKEVTMAAAAVELDLID